MYCIYLNTCFVYTDTKDIDQKTDVKNEETNKMETKKEGFEFKSEIALIHGVMVEKDKERNTLVSDIGPFRRGLCARRDLRIRRRLCKLDKVRLLFN